MSRTFSAVMPNCVPLTICLLALFTGGQVVHAQDDVKPAPGEPQAGVEEGPETTIPSKYNKSDIPNPIAGTETDDDVEALKPADAAELQAQVDDFADRLAKMEGKLQAQADLIAELQKSTMAADNAAGEGAETTTTTRKPALPADPDAASDEGSMTELATLKKELADLRAAIALQTKAQEVQDEELTDTNEQLADLKDGQKSIEGQLRDLMDGGTGSDGNLLGNMQSDPQFRNNLFDSTRYRLRIHNETGAEQLLSVNGVQWTVRSDEWTYVPIPLGPVTVQKQGEPSLAISEESIQWERDSRGFYVSYDLAAGNVVPATSN